MIDSLIQGKLHTKAQRHTSHPHPATAPGFLFLVVPVAPFACPRLGRACIGTQGQYPVGIHETPHFLGAVTAAVTAKPVVTKANG